MEEIQKLMQCFPGSVINSSMDLILNRKTKTGFHVENGLSRKDLLCKIFEWCSRDCAKGIFYKDNSVNVLMRDSLCIKFSKYIGKPFDQYDFYWIYDRLGNAINHERTLQFIENGMDVNWLIKEFA